MDAGAGMDAGTVRAGRMALLILLSAYAVLAMLLPDAPLDDLPNHLARAHVFADLLFDDGSVFGTEYLLQPSLRPYLAGDFVLAILDHLVGPRWSARIWIAAALLLIPLAVRFVLTTLRMPRDTVIAGTLLSLHMATASTFAWGFLHYQLSIGAALFAYGWLVRARASDAPAAWLAFAALTLASFALHLSALLFICIFTGIALLRDVLSGRLTLPRAAAFGCIPALPLLLHVLISESEHSMADASWGSPAGKLQAAVGHVVRYGSGNDMLLFAGFLLAMLVPALQARRRGDGRWPVAQLLCAAAFAAFFVAMPAIAGGIYGLDIRALSYAMLFLMLACVMVASGSPAMRRAQLVAAGVMAVANLAYLATVLVPQQAAMRRYREIAALVPAGERVLPVNTRPPLGESNPFHHAGAFATLDAHALTPYLFARDTSSPQSYFAYLGGRGRAPGEFWYQDAARMRPAGKPDWRSVEQDFQYLLVTVPWDPQLIPAYAEVAHNEVAALLRIEGRATLR